MDYTPGIKQYSILVTGSARFVGHQVARILLDHKARAVGWITSPIATSRP